MGERYDGWVRDEVVGPFLVEKQMDNLPLPAANALEVLTDPSRLTSQQYDLTRKAARQIMLESTGMKEESLRRFIEDLRDHTINRIERRGKIYP